MLRPTGLIAFGHSTGQRYISAEALHDLPGQYWTRGITDAATDQELLKCFEDVIDRVAKRYPDAILTNAHFQELQAQRQLGPDMNSFREWRRGRPMRRHNSLFSGNPALAYTDYYEPPRIVTALRWIRMAARHFGRKVFARQAGFMATVAVVVGIIALFK